MRAIHLQEISQANWRATLEFAVRPDQQRLVAEYRPIAAIVLAKAYIRPGGRRWIPYAICADTTMIGVLALAYMPNSQTDYWIYHFFIDARYQSQGYGQRALDAVLALVAVQQTACQLVQLTVHPDNTPAQRLYERGGFERTDEVIDGDIRFQRRVR